MATRLYFSNDVSTITPRAGTGLWDYRNEAVYRQLIGAARANDVAAAGTEIGPQAGSSKKYLDRGYISAPCASSIAIVGAVKAQLFTKESNAAANEAGLWTDIYFINDAGDWDIDEGCLWLTAQNGDNGELATAYTNTRIINKTPQASKNLYTGFRILIQIGYSCATPYECSAFYGSGNGSSPLTDLSGSGTETDTATYCGWVEFTETITFQSETVTRKLRGHVV